MKKAWSDLKSFITVVVMFLFAYTVILRIPMDENQKQITLMVVSFFLGAQTSKKGE